MKRVSLIAFTLIVASICLAAPSSSSANTTTCKAFTSGEAYCNKPLTAGVTIQFASGQSCTAGPLVLPQAAARRAETYILTAGHCIKASGEGAPWYARPTTGVKMEIGLSGKYIDGTEGDVGVIKINDPGAWALITRPTLYAVMAKWGTLGKEFESVPVVGESASVLNRKTCLEGQTTGESCGKVVNPQVTVGGIENLVEVEEATSAGGDSGGPWYNNELAALHIEGTHVGKIISSGHQVFEPLGIAFRELNARRGLNLELLTTSNEVRNRQTKSGALVLEGGGGTLECTSVEGVSNVSPGSGEVTEGSTLASNVQKWNGCTVKSSLIKGVTANVKECLLQFEGINKTSKTAKAILLNECTVEAKILGICIISLPGGQKGLEKNLLENSGENLLIKAEDTGITSKPNANCPGVKETKEAKLKATLTALGLKEV
jgi:hypothetical protein